MPQTSRRRTERHTQCRRKVVLDNHDGQEPSSDTGTLLFLKPGAPPRPQNLASGNSITRSTLSGSRFSRDVPARDSGRLPLDHVRAEALEG
jgi:hypothetical protein